MNTNQTQSSEKSNRTNPTSSGKWSGNPETSPEMPNMDTPNMDTNEGEYGFGKEGTGADNPQPGQAQAPEYPGRNPNEVPSTQPPVANDRPLH